jgi:hypothetical protein
MAECQGCHAEVNWLPNDETGKMAPVNVTPDPEGNVIYVAGKYHVLTDKEKRANVAGASTARFTLHFVTCPKKAHFKSCRRCHHTPCQCAVQGSLF